jgi:hypothetical protein
MATEAPAVDVAAAADPAFIRERHFRLAAGAALVVMQTLAAVGLGWDIQWHRWIGRDRFLTPPHALIYLGVLGAGLLCIAVVLIESWRYRRHAPGVDDESTVPLLFLNIFRAPLGFFIAGFGALTMAIAAPLDNYWHQLYGIDVTLWAPFHVMGLVGAGIGNLGAAYAVASEHARSRRDGTAGTSLSILGWAGIALGTLFAITAMLRLIRVAMEPSLETFPTWHIGPIELLTSPAVLTLGLVLTSMAAVVVLRRPGAATLMALMAAFFTSTLYAVAPLAVGVFGDAAHYTYRLPGHPHIQWIPVLVPYAYVIPAAVVDIAYFGELRRWHRWRASLIAGIVGAVPMTAIATLLTLDGISSMGAAFRILPTTSTELPAQPSLGAIALGMLLAVAVGAGAGRVGEQLGRIWRLNTR